MECDAHDTKHEVIVVKPTIYIISEVLRLALSHSPSKQQRRVTREGTTFSVLMDLVYRLSGEERGPPLTV